MGFIVAMIFGIAVGVNVGLSTGDVFLGNAAGGFTVALFVSQWTRDVS